MKTNPHIITAHRILVEWAERKIERERQTPPQPPVTGGEEA